jgi:hypothetical protein
MWRDKKEELAGEQIRILLATVELMLLLHQAPSHQTVDASITVE